MAPKAGDNDHVVQGQRSTRPSRISKQAILAKDKIKWLTYHDKHYDKFNGMFPLAVGLPVMFVDHLDRNPETVVARQGGKNSQLGER